MIDEGNINNIIFSLYEKIFILRKNPINEILLVKSKLLLLNFGPY